MAQWDLVSRLVKEYICLVLLIASKKVVIALLLISSIIYKLVSYNL